MAPDRYRSLAALAAAESRGDGYTEILISRPSPVAVVAPHGGGIEPGTSEVARALAGADLSLYCFEGLKERGSRALHVTSTRFDAPACLALLGGAAVVVAVHGCAGPKAFVHVGGRDAVLATRLVAALSAAGFPASLDGTRHAGTHRLNICNRGAREMGVQLELSTALRRAFFAGLTRRGRSITTPALACFVDSVRAVLHAAGHEATSGELRLAR